MCTSNYPGQSATAKKKHAVTPLDLRLSLRNLARPLPKEIPLSRAKLDLWKA